MAHLHAGRARAGRDRGVGRQSRAGRGARGAAPRLPGDDRDAGDDAAHQDRGGRGARRHGGAARRLVLATPTTRRSALQKSSGATFVHPYDDPDVIAGQGTIGMEILRQCQGPLDAIFVAIGGGGLISRHRRVRQARAARGQGHRRAARGLRRDGALARGGPARRAAARGPVRRRRGGEAGRQARRSASCAQYVDEIDDASTPTRPARRSRTCSRTRARSSSPPARSRSPA